METEEKQEASMRRLLLVVLAVVVILSAAIVFAVPSDLSPPLTAVFGAIGVAVVFLGLGLSLDIRRGLRGVTWNDIVNCCFAVPAVIVSGLYAVARGPTIIMSLCVIDNFRRRGFLTTFLTTLSTAGGVHRVRGPTIDMGRATSSA